MNQQLYVGVDGGASKCTVRLEDAAGNLLGEESSGSANVRLSVTQAWESIFIALKKILQPRGIELSASNYQFHVGVGIAGSEIKQAHEAFLNYSHPFKTLRVTSDAHTACLGAHGGSDGAVIIAGTGAVGYQIQQTKMTKVGGFGFPYDDAGSGAWIGLEAVRQTLRARDGRSLDSSLTKSIAARFKDQDKCMVSWASAATSTDYATLAPLVIEHSQQGDEAAINILQRAAGELDLTWQALQQAQLPGSDALPCALVGGVAPFLKPYLGKSLQSSLRACVGTPAQGAILLVRAVNEGSV